MAKRGTYRVWFHHGPDLSIKTRAEKGIAEIRGSSLTVRSATAERDFPIDAHVKVSMFRFHGLARVVRLDAGEERLYLGVVRFMIGQFFVGNHFGTGRLFKELSRLTVS